jgi:hypothetical protein
MTGLGTVLDTAGVRIGQRRGGGPWILARRGGHGGVGRHRTGVEGPWKFVSFFTGTLQEPQEAPSNEGTIQGHPPTPTQAIAGHTQPSDG